ncbi:MAG: hypothetical protein NDI66_01945 [Pseudomonas sp.]|nr:hypothetical protein [Pseudomonas sp.]
MQSQVGMPRVGCERRLQQLCFERRFAHHRRGPEGAEVGVRAGCALPRFKEVPQRLVVCAAQPFGAGERERGVPRGCQAVLPRDAVEPLATGLVECTGVGFQRAALAETGWPPW